MTPEAIVEVLIARFEGLAPKASWGETSLFYNPGHVLANGVYFCTVKDHDGANDMVSNLDRPGVFRVALGLAPEDYEQRFGARPPRPAKGAAVATGHDFTAVDLVMPHPVYAWMGWIQVLNPSTATFEEMQPLFGAAHDRAVRKFEQLLSRR